MKKKSALKMAQKTNLIAGTRNVMQTGLRLNAELVN